MVRSANSRGFSLIELLVALSILAIVAALIVPKFLNVLSQAKDAASSANIAEINNATNNWLSLGGQRATSTGGNEYFYYLLFMSKPGDGIDPKRGLVGGSITADLLPTDSLGLNGSWTISLPNIKMGGGTDVSAAPLSSSSADGFYAKQPASGAIKGGVTNLVASPVYIYEKQGSKVMALNSQKTTEECAASALFLYTGNLMDLKN